MEDLIGQDGLFLESLANALYIPEYKMTLTATHTAYLKIADGCNYRCAYCTIPFIRGAYRSKPMEQIVQEARLLTQNGVKEISLIAQDTTSYGIDLYKKPSLTDLLKKLLKIRGLGRLRIMYAYPNLVTQELADLMAGEKQIFHYLDIPLQHIADPVLKNMNRQCDGKKIKDTLDMLKKRCRIFRYGRTLLWGFRKKRKKILTSLKNSCASMNLTIWECLNTSAKRAPRPTK